jgi:ubiquinone/menaquinone biosynthesis C-methylase UbiE
MFKHKKEYLQKEYWDKRNTALLNQNLSFSDKLNEYIIERKIDIATAFIEKLQPTTVLDAGCGAGSVLLPLAQKYSHITFYAVDFSLENIKQISPLSNVRIFRKDVWNLPFRNQEIDFLFSFDVLYHLTLEQKRLTLNEYSRVAKKHYVNFRGEELTALFHYEFLFRKLRLPRFIRDKLTIYYAKKGEMKEK